MGLGSGIRDPGSRVQKGPDPGSGSENTALTSVSHLNPQSVGLLYLDPILGGPKQCQNNTDKFYGL
jgi:hypothetical protein